MIIANQDTAAFNAANKMSNSAQTWAKEFKDNDGEMSIDEATDMYK